jgi:putative ATPase
LPDAVAGHAFYKPGNNAREAQIRAFMKTLWGDKYGY